MMHARLSTVEVRLFEANGFLNVLNKAVTLDRDNESGDEHHGYSLLIETVKGTIEGIAEEAENIRGILYDAARLDKLPDAFPETIERLADEL